MMQRLLMVGLNHTTAPLEVRERLAMNTEQQRLAIAAFRQQYPQAEIVLLSTCNRVEVYTARAVHGHPRTEEILSFLATFQNVPLESFRTHVYEKSERDVVEHLFSVASSLDSMVRGETQILGQVRAAYELSGEQTAVGGALNPLFQRALAAGKQVMTGTALSEGRLSVASVAVEYARQVFETFHDKTVLTIGAGKMAVATLASFAGLKPGKLLICNRDVTKAEVLAGRFNGIVAPFEKLQDHLVAADIVLTSTGAQDALITRAQFDLLRKRRRFRPLFIIDIAVPRDVEPAVGELDNVYLYNVDDLQDVVAKTIAGRQGAIDAAEAIVRQHVADFAAWQRTRELGPVIDQLYQRSHALAKEELGKAMAKMPNLTDDERTDLEELTRRIVNKLLHDPIRTLRDSDALHAPTGQYVHAMQKLFQLSDGDDPAKERP